MIASNISPRTRSQNDAFEVKDICHILSAEAHRKDCSCDWSLKSYTKTRRSQGPDRDGLIKNKNLLAKILEVAPTGRPGLIALKETWLHLHRKYDIMDKETHLGVDDWAVECSDRVRLAFKHLLDLRDSGSKWIAPEIAELLGKLQPKVSDADDFIPLGHPNPPSPAPQCSTPVKKATRFEENHVRNIGGDDRARMSLPQVLQDAANHSVRGACMQPAAEPDV